MGEDTVSGLMYAEGFVGMSETPEGMQEQVEKAQEYARNRRVITHVNNCAVIVCNEDKVNPVNFS